jgi:hypothetical protein
MLNILWKLIEEEWLIGRSMASLGLQNLINKISHVEFSFGSMIEMTASKLLIFIYKSITIITTAFVSY